MSSRGSARVHSTELVSEQRRFDIAQRERERMRKSLRDSASDGAADPWAAQALARSRRRTMDGLGDIDQEVAFARVDLDSTNETYYIGKHRIEAEEILVVNWRAPAAQPFYLAGATAPMGLARRRKFHTRGNHIVSFDDEVFADIVDRIGSLRVIDGTDGPGEPAADDALLRSLEEDRSAQMRDIVKTIQASQYEIMAAPADRVVIVQGGAGTGKTAVALHRISMLLYREDGRMRASDILVVGPSERFTHFISRVLPDLGDDGVTHGDLQGMGPARSSRRAEEDWIAHLKGEVRMAAVLRRALFHRVRAAADSSGTLSVGTGGSVARFTAAELRARLRQLVRESSYERGRRQFRHWLSSESSMRTRSRTAVGSAHLDSAANRMWPEVTAEEVLAELFCSTELLETCAGDDLTGDEVRALIRTGVYRNRKPRWSDADVALLDELSSLIGGLERGFKHVVVDEAQDLSPMQWRSILRRCRNGACTLVGDIAQSTGPFARSSWADVKDLFIATHEVEIHELQHGYRVPKQVFALASRVLPLAAPGVTVPTAVRRGPSDPVIETVSGPDLSAAVARAAQNLVSLDQFTAVIADESSLDAIESELRLRSIPFDQHSSESLETGLTLLTPTQAKGLEFDAVVVVEPEEIAIREVTGARELYIALTRTTRHLHIVHTRACPMLRLPGIDDPAPRPASPDGPPAADGADELFARTVAALASLSETERRSFVKSLAEEIGLVFNSEQRPSGDVKLLSPTGARGDGGPPALPVTRRRRRWGKGSL